MSDPLLRIEDLHIEFQTSRSLVRALNGVSLELQAGEVFGLVGETGCGKSITGLSILRLLPRSARITRGQILFEGQDMLQLSEAEMRGVRGRKAAVIFQDPSTALNPVFTIGHQIEKVIRQHMQLNTSQANQRALEVLEAVGLPDLDRIHQSYPHQLSGGMQQRVVIALAISCLPSLIIADEPTTALDVTIQSQILALLANLQQRMGIAMILITHNLGVVADICDRLAVLYAGKVAEIGTTRAIFENPQHPYTRGLLAAIPTSTARGQPLAAIPGTVPSNPGMMTGCTFAPRCAYAHMRCHQETPPLYAVTSEHSSACFLNDREANL